MPWNVKCHAIANVMRCQMIWNSKCHEMSNVMKCQISCHVKYHDMSNVMRCQMSWDVKCHEMSNVNVWPGLSWSVLVCPGLSWSVLFSVSNTNIYIQLTYSGICGGRIFLPSRCHFFQLWRLIMTTFCMPALLSIGCPGQSCLRDSGKLSFAPATSG